MYSRVGGEGQRVVNEIVTTRLRLRQLDVGEARALLDGRAHPERPWIAGYPIEGTLIAVEAFLRQVSAGGRPGPYGVYQLVRLTDSLVLGDIGFHAPPDRVGTVTVGYGLAAPARGHGYATEALRGVIDWALAQPGVRRVEADTAHSNLPSRRVMERAGMRFVGQSDLLRFYRFP
jgi:RimJ/RimL family protein N-acetyltransferase